MSGGAGGMGGAGGALDKLATVSNFGYAVPRLLGAGVASVAGKVGDWINGDTGNVNAPSAGDLSGLQPPPDITDQTVMRARLAARMRQLGGGQSFFASGPLGAGSPSGKAPTLTGF